MSTNVTWPDEDEPLTLSFEGKPMHTGYSRLSKFLACPRQYKLVYIEGHRGISTTPMRRGNAYHSTLEAALRRKFVAGKAMSHRKLMEFATYHGEQEGLPEKVVEEVRGAAGLWHATYYPKMDPLFVEASFVVHRLGVKFTGRVDAAVRTVKTQGGRMVFCDKRAKLVDHKFSFDTWTDARARESVQPAIYQWAWEDVFGPQTGLGYQQFDYHILRTHPYFAAETITIGRLSAEGSAWMMQNVREVAEAMCKGCYFARPSVGECSRCSFKKDVCKPELYRVSRETFGEEERY